MMSIWQSKGNADKRRAAEAAAKFQAATALHKQGLSDRADALCTQVLRDDPRHFGAWHLQGLLALQRGDLEHGVELINRSLQICPQQPAAHSNIGNALLGKKQPERALVSFERALQIHSGFAVAWANRGYAMLELGRAEEAVTSIERALRLQPQFPQAQRALGTALLNLGRPSEALRWFEKVRDSAPDDADANFDVGVALYKLVRCEEALAHFDRALRVDINHVKARIKRADCLRSMRLPEVAVPEYEHVLQMHPDEVVAWNNLGNALLCMNRQEAALRAYDQALRYQPGSAEALLNRGVALLATRQHEAALDFLDRALRAEPDRIEAQAARGRALKALGRGVESIDCFRQLLQRQPDHELIQGHILHASLNTCDWTDLDARVGQIDQYLDAGKNVSDPFSYLAVAASAEQQLRCARVYAKAVSPKAWPPLCCGVYAHARMRVAYVSANFGEHALCCLMAGVFEQHDRQRIESIAISLRPAEDSAMGKRVRAAFPQFVDVSDRSDWEVAELMRELEVDIAVDLMGHTDGARPEIFAHRPAPIQVSYLGYPGSTGAPYIDYIIGDAFLIPEQSQRFYSEKIAYLPDSFQANDDRRIAPPALSRANLGSQFEQAGVLLCAFNNNYKLNPTMLDIWCRVLAAVEDSVLWVTGDDALARENLRREVGKRGVDPNRLLTADRVAYDQYLGRLAAADLFLDTLPFNGGTTVSDALWAGLPVLTCAGQSFSSRMAGSLLRAVGLPELITENLGDYERRAIELARAPRQLAQLRQALVRNRLQLPLFQTDRFCRHLEAAYTKMLERVGNGQSPDHISVGPLALTTGQSQ
jgi:protein O-GlcNAc transferase